MSKPRLTVNQNSTLYSGSTGTPIAGIMTNGSGNARIDATIAELVAEEALAKAEEALAITGNATLVLNRLEVVEQIIQGTQIAFSNPGEDVWAEFAHIK